MEIVARQKKLRPSQAGFFFQLTSKFESGSNRVTYMIPHGYVGDSTRNGGTISLVDLGFCTKNDCTHFDAWRRQTENFPQAPPDRPNKIRTIAPLLLPKTKAFREKEVLRTSIDRPKRALEEEEEQHPIFYTVGYRRSSARTSVTFGESDSMEKVAKKIADYHIVKMNHSYNDMLGTPVKLEFEVITKDLKIQGGATKKITRWKTKFHIPANFSLGLTQAFLLEGLGFDAEQFQTFKLTGDPATQYFGFVNQTNLEAVITSRLDFDPAVAGRYFMHKKKAIADLFKVKGSDHTRVCLIGIASEFLESPYQKKILLPQTFFSSNPDASAKARYANSVFSGILDDLEVGLNLRRKTLTSVVQDKSLYLRSRQRDTEDLYNNLTVHFQMKPSTSVALGLDDFDIRWDCLQPLKLAQYNMDSLGAVVEGDLASPEGKKILGSIRSSPKKKIRQLASQDLLEGITEEEKTFVTNLLANPAPVNADKLDEERVSATELGEKESALRLEKIRKRQELTQSAKKRKLEQQEAEAAEAEKQRKLQEANRMRQLLETRAAEEEAKKQKQIKEAAAVEAEKQRKLQEAERQRLEEEKNRQAKIKEAQAAAAAQQEAEEAERQRAAEEAERRRIEEEEEAERRRIEEEEEEVDIPVGPFDEVILEETNPLGPYLEDPDLDLDLAGTDPSFREIDNPEPILSTNFVAFTDDPFVGHGTFVAEDEVLVSNNYTVVFEGGVKSDYIEGIGPCCVLAYLRKDRSLDKKFICEYPKNWDGNISLSLYNHHQVPIVPTNDCLSVINVIVNHF